jgi:hypothetical protein
MLEVTGQVLIRCFVMGVLVLFFWLGALTLGGDLAYNYAGGLMTKATIFVLFLFPYIAIRLVIRKRRS